MAERKTSTEPAPAPEAAKAEASKAALQAVVDQAEQQGYYGEVPDETPNRSYTVAGVTEGQRT